MRTLNRNKQPLYYALYKGKTEYVDEYGNKTGEYTTQYETPVKTYMNISPARGNIVLEQFGINTQYTHILVTDKMDCPIAKDTILWIGKTPDNEGKIKHNFVVKQIAKSLNSISYAISEVEIS